ncbi:MAG: LAGLIDADG family homing endonuclease [Candidatus Pacearchaeota archaeon]
MSKKIEIPKEKLKDLYLKQKLSTYKIAELYGCDPTVIQKKLRGYKIKLRKPKKKIIIDKEKLRDLYLKKGLSTQKISNILGISSCSVYYKLKEANIEIRKKRIFNINKEKLKELYIKNRLSCSKIAKIYNFNVVTVFEKLKKYSIKTRNLFEANVRYPKKAFDGSDELKAYMIGFRLGDLNVKSSGEDFTVIIKSSTTKRDQVNLIKEVYGKYGHFWIKKYDKIFSMMVFLDKSFNFLVKKEDNIEDWIKQENKIFFAFLAGYTDAEGNISISNGMARFRIRSYDKNLLFQIYEKLNLLGINAKFGLASKKGNFYGAKHNKDCWGVFVYSKEDLISLFNLIKHYMKHKKRLNDLTIGEQNIWERIKKQSAKL